MAQESTVRGQRTQAAEEGPLAIRLAQTNMRDGQPCRNDIGTSWLLAFPWGLHLEIWYQWPRMEDQRRVTVVPQNYCKSNLIISELKRHERARSSTSCPSPPWLSPIYRDGQFISDVNDSPPPASTLTFSLHHRRHNRAPSIPQCNPLFV